MTILAIARDKAALVGLGSAGEPQGIVNLSNLATSVTLTNAGTITYADAVRFETNLLNSNALLGSLGFVTTPTVRGGTKIESTILRVSRFSGRLGRHAQHHPGLSGARDLAAHGRQHGGVRQLE